MIEKVGLMPINDYIHGLGFRGMGKIDSIIYTKENYDINLYNEIQQANFWYRKSIYDEFKKLNPIKIEDDGTRDYFNTYAKKYFYKYIRYTGDYDNGSYTQEYFLFGLKASIVHHIFPLVYSNDNSIENLINVSTFSHDILHRNPFENIKKCNFQAVDYLYYLTHSGLTYLTNKYNINKYTNSNPKTFKRIFLGSIEDEMDYFYEYLKEIS